MPEIVKPESVKYRRYGIHAYSKHGKTRLATSIPWGEVWGEKAVYVAWDWGSEALESVLPQHREHLVVVKPSAGPGGKVDPMSEASTIASRDWRKELGVGTLIWDTATATSDDILAALELSEINKDPRQNYQQAQTRMKNVLRFLFSQPLNIVMLFQSDPLDSGDPGSMIGPGMAGRKGINVAASMFDNLFRIEVRDKPVPGTPPRIKQEYVVHTSKKGRWMAGLRTGHVENPLPEFVLGDDPVEFWKKVREVQG